MYAANGASLLASASSTNWAQPAVMYWQSDRNELVYLRMRHVDGRVIGNDVTYQLLVGDNLAFLPLISR